LKRKIHDELKIPAIRQKLSVGPIGLDRNSGLVRELVKHGTIVDLISQQQAKRPRNEEDNKHESSASNKKKKKPKKLQKKEKQNKNPDGSEKTKNKFESWSCPQCTYLNEPKYSLCRMCQVDESRLATQILDSSRSCRICCLKRTSCCSKNRYKRRRRTSVVTPKRTGVVVKLPKR